MRLVSQWLDRIRRAPRVHGESSVIFGAGGPLPQPPRPPLPLPLLDAEAAREPTRWLCTSLTTFAQSVASFVPGHFVAYARLYHPFEQIGLTPLPATTWRELARLAGREMPNGREAGEFAWRGVPGAVAHSGTIPVDLLDTMVERLRLVTAPSMPCYFAVWDGYGDSILPPATVATLQLPNRAYHVFTGSLDDARASYSRYSLSHGSTQSANIWWPADRAWCVATEYEFAWTYVGGSRACIDSLLADERLEAVETSATARW